jgi:chromosome segregation ATPase
MTTDTLQLDREALHATFDSWTAVEESLDVQLSESLEALAAYQSHLDAWQKQLAEQRNELIQSREQFERDQATAAATQANSSAEVGAELATAREKVAELTANLLTRTEELRALDGRRTELATELEVARSHEKELTFALEEQKRLREEERSKASEELRHLRELLEQRGENRESIERAGTTPNSSAPPAEPPRPAVSPSRDRSNGGAVLGSIVEQFGKLRQQRAVDRQGSKKPR